MVTAFFVTMNVLLWRSEFGERGRLGAALPAEVVWEKVLTSPDNSFLEIHHKGRKIGRAHWAASIGEERSAQLATDEPSPEGMVKVPTGYSLDFDGTFAIDSLKRVRFLCVLRLDTNQDWQEVSLKLSVKPESWELHAAAGPRTLRFVTDDEEGRKEQSFSFDDLRSPDKFARALGGSLLPGSLAALGLPLKQAKPSSLAPGLKWEARSDWLTVGRNRIRVYRLEARLFDRFKAVLIVSPVGEILRLELPDQIILNNEALNNL